MLNGNVFAYRSFNPELEKVKTFADFGVDWVCIYPSNTLNSLGLPYSAYGPMWLELDTYDFEPLDREIQDLLDVNPDVQIICMVDLNTPSWLVRRLAGMSGGQDSFHELGRVVSMARWREVTQAYMQAFLRHTESRYPDTVKAYMLCCGGTCEWQDRSFGEESGVRRAAFRAWAQEQGMADPVDIPPASVRDHVSHDLLRDPEADAAALAYWEFCNWQIGDTILTFAEAAQEIIAHRAEVGAFYGYILTFGQNRLVSEGHLDYERVYASPNLDFFVAPATYINREMGGTSPFLAPVGSVRHQGKGWIQELDHRTYTSNPPADWYTCAFNLWNDEQETVVGLRREFSFCLIEDVSLWWFDMWGGFYEGETVLGALAQMKAIWDRAQQQELSAVAEIAWIVDPESALYLDQSNPRINAFTRGFNQVIARCGAPHHTFSWGDLEDLDLSPYRLVVFSNLFVMNDERRRILQDSVCRNGRTVLWLYRPGVIANGRYDEDGVQRLTGVPIDAADTTTRDMGQWRSVLSPTPEITPRELRTVAQEAGVHIYSDHDEPCYVNSRFVALHTAEGGPRRIVLPRHCSRITELFSGREVARDTDVIEDTLSGPDTVLYGLE